MPEQSKQTPSPAFDRAAQQLGCEVASFWFNHYPDEEAAKLKARIKMAAKLLEKAAGLPHARALDAVAQGLRFSDGQRLLAHLDRANSFPPGALPAGWLDALSAAVFLVPVIEDDVSLPTAHLNAFEVFGEALAMLTDAPTPAVLDTVTAALCGGRSWAEVRRRTPLKSIEPLYRFDVIASDAEGGVGGLFSESPACEQLVRQLDEVWQGYDDFTKPRKKRARGWVEAVLLAQPGFLEGILALAWMQRDAEETTALATVNRGVKAADAYIPKGFKGRILWGHLGNRFYHRLLWLQLELNHEQSQSGAAAKVARRMLRLNPGDNLGVRYVLPMLLLEQGDLAGARRALKALADEPGLTASATRAFVSFADGRLGEFRRELATALFTLPVLRAFLMNSSRAMPPGESGYRQIRPDMEGFSNFAWPSYCGVPGLRRACVSFLAEPAVRAAERELAAYWADYWEAGRIRGAVRKGSAQGWQGLLAECIERIAPVSSEGLARGAPSRTSHPD